MVGGVTTQFLYDGDNVVGEYDAAGFLTVRYVQGPGLDAPVLMERGAARHWYHFDGAGSVVALSNASGALAERYAYSPYGQSDDTSPAGNPYRFTARRLDAETGLYHYRARAYSPLLGRFLQPDPAGFVDGLNLYAYVGNDPLNRTDPTGRFFNLIAAGIGAAVGAGFEALDQFISVSNGTSDGYNLWKIGRAGATGAIAGLGGVGVGNLAVRAYQVGGRAAQIAFSTGGNALVGATTNVGLQISNNIFDPRAAWDDNVYYAAGAGFVGGAAAGLVAPYADAALTACTGFGGCGNLSGAGIVLGEIAANAGYVAISETYGFISEQHYTSPDDSSSGYYDNPGFYGSGAGSGPSDAIQYGISGNPHGS